MDVQQECTGLDQGFFTRENMGAGRLLSCAAILNAPKQLPQRSTESLVFYNGTRERYVRSRARLRIAQHGSDHSGLQIHHAPATRSAANRAAIMHFTGVGRDQIACVGLDLPLAASGALRTALQQPKTKRSVPVFAVVTSAIDVRAIDIRPRRAENPTGVIWSDLHVSKTIAS